MQTFFSGVTKVGRILSGRPVHFATLVTWRRKQGRGTPLTSSAEIKISTPRTGVRRGRGRTTSRTNCQSEISRTTSGCLETAAVHRFDFLFDLINLLFGFENNFLKRILYRNKLSSLLVKRAKLISQYALNCIKMLLFNRQNLNREFAFPTSKLMSVQWLFKWRECFLEQQKAFRNLNLVFSFLWKDVVLKSTNWEVTFSNVVVWLDCSKMKLLLLSFFLSFYFFLSFFLFTSFFLSP
jgi:hypothetical protein